MGIAYGVKHPQLEKRVYFLYFITLINVFIFKKQLFKHQKLALIITAIGVTPIYTAFFVYHNSNFFESIYYLKLHIKYYGIELYFINLIISSIIFKSRKV